MWEGVLYAPCAGFDSQSPYGEKMKTKWQKVYSFFGFWKYEQTDENWETRKVIYWCCFPWFKFYRKFDIFSYSLGKKYPKLKKKLMDLGEYP